MKRRHSSTKTQRAVPPAGMPDEFKKMTVLDRVILYGVFLIFKLMNCLTACLPKAKKSDLASASRCVRMETNDQNHIVSIALPKDFEKIMENYSTMEQELRMLKKTNSELRKHLREAKANYMNKIISLEIANGQLAQIKTDSPLPCQNCEVVNAMGRIKLKKAIDQSCIKLQHLRAKCEYGIEDLKKVRDGKEQSLVIRDISNYHISSLEKFNEWMDLKVEKIRKLEKFIKFESNKLSMADIFNQVDMNEIIATVHIGMMTFFKKYFVLLMVSLADKEYIQSTVDAKIKQTYKEHLEEAKEDPPLASIKTQPNTPEAPVEQVEYGGEPEQINYNDYRQKGGKYYDIYLCLLDYLEYDPQILIECMAQVKRENDNTFKNLSIFDIANRVEKTHQMYC